MTHTVDELRAAGPPAGTGSASELTDADTGSGSDSEIARRLGTVRADVERAARTSGRVFEDITIVAVTKTWDAPVIAEAARAGQRHFGESKAQELRDKRDDPALADVPDIQWHFIGRLQTNKVKYVVGSCALVHSLDRWDLAEALHDRAVHEGVTQPVLVQVNIDDDPAKGGVRPEDVASFLKRCGSFTALRIQGLMAIPAFDGDARSAFARLRQLRDELRSDHPELTHLSMGMSADYVSAIEEGATMIRPGQAIFGARPQQASPT